MDTKEANWAMLPALPLCLIFEKLVALSDFLRFAVVCKEWRRVVTDKENNNIRRWLESCSNQVPFLLVRSTESGPSFYSLASQQLLHSSQQLFVKQNFRCSGSSYGWLAFATGEDNDFEITLYNPFTGDTINDLPHVEKELSMVYPHFFITKVILSANPSVSRDDLYIVVMYHGMHELALLKYGQKSWTYIDFMGSNLVSSDIIFFKGFLYTVTYWARIASIDIVGSLNTNRQETLQPKFILQTKSDECAQIEYLVESSQRDLLVVRKYYKQCWIDGYIQRDFKFEVYKVIIPSDGNGTKLEKVNSLGNDALFIGDNHSMSVSILEFPKCQPDSIYFTDDGYDPGYFEHHGPRNNGIYNLKDGTIQNFDEPFPVPGEDKHMLPPIWIIPSPNFLRS